MESTEKLADFIRLKMKEQNLSAADVARRAGNELSPTIITKIVSGEVRRSSTKTLALIAKGIGVDELDVFRAASGEDVTRPIHHQIYADRFEAGDLTETEWQFLETYFRDTVERFRADKAALERQHIEMADKIAATITPPKHEKTVTRDDVQKMLDKENVIDLPKKKKTA